MARSGSGFSALRLIWLDVSLGVITLENGSRMRLTLGLGSGLSLRLGDPKGTIWAIADRGPNLKIKPAIERYGLEHSRHSRELLDFRCLSPHSLRPLGLGLLTRWSSTRACIQSGPPRTSGAKELASQAPTNAIPLIPDLVGDDKIAAGLTVRQVGSGDGPMTAHFVKFERHSEG